MIVQLTVRARRTAALGLTAVVVTVLAGLPAAATTATATATGRSADRTLHVDCSADAAAAEGTRRHPYATLAQVNAVELTPGTRVAFKRGVTCEGTFSPRGRGRGGGR